MKKGFKYGLLFMALITTALTACQGNSSQSSTNTSATEIIEITGYDIFYPYNMVVGESDVISFVLYGTNSDGEQVNDDRATFDSKTPEIISVDTEGRIKALTTGEALITVTSIPFPEITINCEITVEANKSETITLFANTDGDVELVGEKQYRAPIGQTIILNYELDSIDSLAPTNILYSVIDENGTYSGLVDILKNEDGSGSLVFYAALENVPIKITADYQDGVGKILSDTIFVTSYDKTVEIFENINQAINNIDESSLISADITISTSLDEYEQYNFSVYDYASILNNPSGTKTINALDKNINRYYLFSLDKSNNVDVVTKNENYTLDTETTYVSYATSYPRQISGETIYGFKNLLSYIVNNNNFEEMYGFAYYAAKAYLEFDITESDNQTHIEISTQFEESGDTTSMSLSFEYNNINNTLISYKYTYENSVTYYSESTTNFEYGVRETMPTDLIAKYYIENFDVKCIAGEEAALDGTYDFSDESLYGYESVTTIDGIEHYKMYYSKSLPFQIIPTSPNEASLKIDILTVEGVSENGTRSFTCAESGLAIISGVKDNKTGSMLETEETITFSTLNGIKHTIVVEFIAPEIESITLSDGTANIQNNVFPKMFQNTTSGYFYLTSNPDDVINYIFDIKLISGEEGGLTFKKWESNNIYGYPDFSYSLIANKVGKYQFAFYVTENENVLSETYEVEVIEAYSADYIASSIVDQKYIYSTGQTNFELSVTNNNIMKLLQSNAYSSEITATFNYEISTGKITTVGDYQELTEGFYFSHIKGDINFSDDFSYLDLYLAIADSQQTDIDNLSFQWYRFQKIVSGDNVIDKINGKTFTTSSFIYGYTMSTISIKFDNGSGVLTMENASNGVYATFTFSYSYQKGEYNDSFVFSNVTSTDGFSFKNNENEYYPTSSSLQIYIITPYSGTSGQRIDFTLI